MDRRVPDTSRLLSSLLRRRVRTRRQHDPDERGVVRALVLFVGGELLALLAIGAGLLWLAHQYRP